MIPIIAGKKIRIPPRITIDGQLARNDGARKVDIYTDAPFTAAAL